MSSTTQSPKRSGSKSASQSPRTKRAPAIVVGDELRPQAPEAEAAAEPAQADEQAGGKPKSKASRKGKSKSKAAPKKRKFTAKGADKHELYQLAVQSPDVDAEFLAKTYKRIRGKHARHLREDFCGTGYLMAEWLRRHPENTAEGFDIDPGTVAWGLERNFNGIDDAAERAVIHVKDVREPGHTKPDVRTAPNFSWMILTQRSDLLSYFQGAREGLADDGLFVIDIYGGSEAYEEMEEVRKIDAGFTYVWDQVAYWPATGDYHCKIHFKFKDGTELKSAFDYRWRLWGLPEVIDLLKEAGFSKVESYWEGTDEDGENGNGVYRKSKKGENCPAWVTYVVAQK
jgi:hypothetical protein